MGTGNVNDMQIFPYNRKGIPSAMSTEGRKVVINVQNLVNVVKERPLQALILGLWIFFDLFRNVNSRNPR